MGTERPYWHIQQASRPLFPELIWSKPEGGNAGKLLIIGGNSGSFRAPAEAYGAAMKAGVGSIRLILPASLQKVIGKQIEEAEFAPSNSSGSFSQQALDIWLEQADWADGILLAGDFGHSSETTVLIEKFILKTSTSLTLTHDSLDSLLVSPNVLMARPMTTLVPTLSQLQKLAKNLHFPYAFSSSISLMQFAEGLHELTTQYTANVVILHQENLLVGVRGQVSSTKVVGRTNISLATHCAVWLLQNPSKPFEALTTACSASN